MRQHVVSERREKKNRHLIVTSAHGRSDYPTHTRAAGEGAYAFSSRILLVLNRGHVCPPAGGCAFLTEEANAINVGATNVV